MTRRDSAAAESGATRVADALRSTSPALDELTRARMERRLLDAPRERTSHVTLDRGRLDLRGRPDRRARMAWGAGGALVAAAAALAIGWIVWPRGAPVGPEGPVARFTIDGPGQGASGEVRVGGSLEVGPGERASVQVGHAEIDLAGAGPVDRERGIVRFASLDARDLRLDLTSGRVDVAFHPVERGRERLTIETPSARVEVVGTVFSVRIEDDTTRVAVSEGIVRVVPHGAGGSAVMVRAGESVAVREGGAARVEGAEIGAGTEARAEARAGTGTEPETETTETETAETGTVVARRTSARGPVAVEVAVPQMPAAQAPVAEYAPAPPEVDRPAVVAVSPRRRYEAADAEIARGNHAVGREVLEELVRDRSVPRSLRVEAQALIGDSYQSQGDLARAIAAFERTAVLGAGRDEGANAIMSIARVYIRQGRTDEARRTYLRYLDEYPLGPNRTQARDWICAHGGDPSVECGPR